MIYKGACRIGIPEIAAEVEESGDNYIFAQSLSLGVQKCSQSLTHLKHQT